jgi:uroporphyrinogen decarboxylase
MHQEYMTPKERWLAVLERRTPDRVPMDYWGTPEITQKLQEYLGCETSREMMKKLHIDFVISVWPIYIGPELPAGYDIFGCRGQAVNYGTGEYWETVGNPLAQFHSVSEIEKNYTWPQADWWDYTSISEQIKGYEAHPIVGGGSEPFLTYKNLRGQEQAMIDLVENPDLVHYCLDKLFELSYQNSLRIIEAIPGQVTYCYVAEDLGGQSQLMFSPKHIREYLFPGMKRMIQLTHQAGAYVFHHDDGNITQILPEIVDLGIDILNPIQWRASGMDRKLLKQQYGSRLVFHGGMDNQYTLPFGSVDEVRKEVIENFEILGKEGGYILAPCHNIQPISPVENILAMYETGYEEGFLMR